MFFLSDDERRMVLRKLLPESRRVEVHPELRGWNWSEAPVAPIYDVPLGLAEVAGRYCPTGRDVYLRRVAGVKVRSNVAMEEGRLLHGIVADQLLRAMRAIYSCSVDGALDALESVPDGAAEAVPMDRVPEGAREELRRKISALASFEHHRVVARVAEVLARQPRVGSSGLVALALPVSVEVPLDGRLLGLSSHLSTDALSLFAPMVVDLKFGPRRDFHRLATAGYAMVMESLHESPIDLGCVTYARVEGGRVSLERDIHLIDDELRQWFLEVRDETMRMVSEESDPGRGDDCPESCPYWRDCRA